MSNDLNELSLIKEIIEVSFYLRDDKNCWILLRTFLKHSVVVTFLK
jgi:hypothetical protein